MQEEQENKGVRTNTERKDVNDELEERTRQAEEADFTNPNKNSKDATPRSPEDKDSDKEGLGSSVERNINTTEKKEVAAGPIPSTPHAKINTDKKTEDSKEEN